MCLLTKGAATLGSASRCNWLNAVKQPCANGRGILASVDRTYKEYVIYLALMACYDHAVHPPDFIPAVCAMLRHAVWWPSVA
jgi:hypothetical protein